MPAFPFARTRLKWLLTSAALALGVLGVVAYLGYRAAVREESAAFASRQRALLERAAQSLETELRSRGSDLRQLGTLPIVQRLTLPFLPGRFERFFTGGFEPPIDAIIRIAADGRQYTWAADGHPLDRVYDIPAGTLIEWGRDSPLTAVRLLSFERGEQTMAMLVAPVRDVSASPEFPAPTNAYCGVVGFVFNLPVLLEHFTGAAGGRGTGRPVYIRDTRVAAAAAGSDAGSEDNLVLEVPFSFGGRSWVLASDTPLAPAQRSIRLQWGFTATLAFAGIATALALLTAYRERASDFRYERLIEQAAEPIVVCDAANRVRDANPAAERLFAAPLAALTHQPLETLIEVGPPTYSSSWRRGVIAVGGGRTNVELSEAQLTPDDRLVLIRDVSERELLEAQLRQSHKLESVGRLAGGIAHDFNNLLTIIIGHADIALDATSDGVREDIVAIQQAAARAASLTRQLLTFSRQQRSHPVPVQVGRAVEHAGDMLQRLLTTDVALRVEDRSGGAAVTIERGHLEQVLMNLAANGRDAMPDGGRLTIAIDADDASVTLAISDTGQGIDAETQLKIFEPFFTTKDVGRGTGLGLAITYGIVKDAGGEIRVESAPGKGATFVIQFPRSDRAVDPPAA